MKYDVLSLGPARMDVFVKLPDEEVEQVCTIDRQKCVIELGFGEKIPVVGMEFAIGGNAGNNAVGLARLGLKAALVGVIGDGWSDQQVLKILGEEGVDTSYLEIRPGEKGFGVVINYQEERTILSYYSHSRVTFPQDGQLRADWIYLTSMGEGYEAFYQQAVGWARKWGARIAFNPGTRQIKAGLEHLGYAYNQTEVLFVNREEAAQLLGVAAGDIKGLLAGLKKLGPRVVVMTDGPNGTYCYDGKSFWHMPIVEAPVVERTGAGDAFGSGFLAAVVSGQTVEEALIWGTVNSASVLGYVGSQAGLLTTKQLPGWLAKAQAVRLEGL